MRNVFTEGQETARKELYDVKPLERITETDQSTEIKWVEQKKELSHNNCSVLQMIIDNETVFLFITPTGKEQMNEL